MTLVPPSSPQPAGSHGSPPRAGAVPGLDAPELVLPLPAGWTPVDLDAETLDGFATFVQAARPVLASAGLPVDGLEDLLRGVARDRRLDDVRVAATWWHTEDDGGLVQADLSITVVPADVRATLADDPVWDVTTLAHPDGDTVVRRTRTTAFERSLPPLGGALAGLDDAVGTMMGMAEYLREVPGRPELALVMFSSVTLGAWRHLLTLFDNLVLASHWITADPVRP